VEKIKVVRLITRMNIGGPAIHVSLLSGGLDKDAFSSTLITGRVSSNEGDMTYLAGEFGVKPLVIPELHREPDIISDIITFFKLYKFIKKERPDVIHTHSSKAGLIGRIVARLLGVPVVIHTIHGHVFHSYFSRPKTIFFIFLESLLAGITDRIVAISETLKKEIKEYLGLKDDAKLALIPLGFDLDRFLQSDKDDRGDELRGELGIEKEAIVIGAVGRLTAVKNRKMFLETAREIKKANSSKNIKFLIVGDGELKEELMALADKLDIRKDVIFAGWRKNEDMHLVYRAMDIVTLTSLNEGTTVSAIEALAGARPVVTTAAGGVKDVIEDNKSGFIVPINDVDAFSNKVSALINDKEKRDGFGSHGRDFVKNKYSSKRLITDIEKLYYSELQKKGKVQ